MSPSGQGASPKLSHDFDKILNNAFQAGEFSRNPRVGDWQVITGMQINLPEAMKLATTRSGKLLILGHTITVGNQSAGQIDVTGFSTVLVMGATVNQYYEAKFFSPVPNKTADSKFYFGVYAKATEVLAARQLSTLRDVPDFMLVSPESYQSVGLGTQATLLEIYGRWKTNKHGERIYHVERNQSPIPFSSLPLEACKAFLSRIQLAAQSEAAGGRREIASQLLDCLQQMLSLFPADVFSDLRLQSLAVRELIQPVRLESDQVPYLSPKMYETVAKEYGPVLKALADSFTNFMNRSFDHDQRKQAAERILDEKEDLADFQKLVGNQLSENLKLANENVSKAQQSITAQGGCVQQAASTFRAGMKSWEDAQKREAALAIVGGVISFVGGIASLFGGNPEGATKAAKAAEDVAKTAKTLSKLADLMEKLKKIGQVIAKIVELCAAINEAMTKIGNAHELAERMSKATTESKSEHMQDAPSAGAYWDQLWVEVETQLKVVVDKEIDGALEYLKELKVLIIYARALTTAQAALPPIIQEIARANLSLEIADRQKANVGQEIKKLENGQAASAEAAAVLWLRYRGVQRSMLVALQKYDAAHRYWILSDTREDRNLDSSMNVAKDLMKLANLAEQQENELDDLKPEPQNFRNKRWPLPEADFKEFLETGQFVLRFAPGRSPMDGMGRIGRVRVEDISVWVEWKSEDDQPARGNVEFSVRTNGIYADQRVRSGKLQSFCFVATPLNLTFSYDLESYSYEKRKAAITIPGSVAKQFRGAFFEPTLFTEWRLSLPAHADGEEDSALDLKTFAEAAEGITVEFSGTFMKALLRAV